MLPRPLSLALLALTLTTGCRLFGSRAQAPERFVGADAALVVVVPSLEGLSRQGSDLLATAATFPGGQAVLDGRAVLQARLGFDPFDPSSVAAAGLDPKRGAAVGVHLARAERKPGAPEQDLLALARSGGEPQFTAALPVSDAGKLGAALARIAKDRLGLGSRTTEAGKPEVIVFHGEEHGPDQLAYAIAEGTAVLGFGPTAVEDVRAALAVPRDAHLGTTAPYKAAAGALGTGLAALVFMPPGSPLLEESPQVKDGVAFGLRAAKDRLELAGCTLLGAREAAVRSAVKGGAAPLVAKLEPGAELVARSETDLSTLVPREELAALIKAKDVPDEIGRVFLDAHDAVGSGMALGVGLVPPGSGTGALLLQEAPFAFFRAELLVGLKDAAKMKALLGKLPEDVRRMTQESGGLSTVTLPGGEVGWTVQQDRLVAAVGPKGSLQALVARTGSTFKAPTPTSAKALEAGVGGMFADVPRLARAAQAIPEASYGAGMSAGALHSSVQQWATTAARIQAISVASELVPGAQRSTLVIEVAPAK